MDLGSSLIGVLLKFKYLKLNKYTASSGNFVIGTFSKSRTLNNLSPERNAFEKDNENVPVRKKKKVRSFDMPVSDIIYPSVF